jgi:hypothetical protein
VNRFQQCDEQLIGLGGPGRVLYAATVNEGSSRPRRSAAKLLTRHHDAAAPYDISGLRLDLKPQWQQASFARPALAATAAAARSTGYRPSDPASGSLAKFAAIPSDLPDRIASVFLLLPLFGKQIEYLLPV